MHYALELAVTVRRATDLLRQIPESAAGRRPAPGKWCAKEIIGHLIDSAAHNHQRFVRARWQDDLIFSAYAQDDWVQAQGYVAAPWLELLDLWLAYNLHLSRIMQGVPEATRQLAHSRHNLDRLAWMPPPPGRPVTLDYFMADYVGHLKHHLRQIDGLGLLTVSLIDA